MQKDAIKKTKWGRKLLTVIGIILISISILLFAKSLQNDFPTVVINKTTIDVEFAITSQEKKKGLCCRDSLPENNGMLFVYDEPGRYAFWMKDTRIPLDMYWINADKKIVHIEHSVQPDSYPQSFGPNELAQYILETNAGFAKKHNITVGDTASF